MASVVPVERTLSHVRRKKSSAHPSATKESTGPQPQGLQSTTVFSYHDGDEATNKKQALLTEEYFKSNIAPTKTKPSGSEDCVAEWRKIVRVTFLKKDSVLDPIPASRKSSPPYVGK